MPTRALATLLTAATLAAATGCGGSDDESGRQSPPNGGSTAADPPTEAGGPRVRTVARGLEVPWEIAFMPDGRALVTERPGRVRLLSKRLELRERPLAEVEVSAVGEGGLLGLAVDPQFDRNGFVYLYRTAVAGNEVVRYRFDGDTDTLTEEATILKGLRSAPIHNGGRIRFGPDGLLYVSTGEAGEPSLAQDSSSLNGKLLRLFDFRGDGGRPAVFSSGHRNVQGFDWQPRTGRLYATEFGPDAHDEINLVRRGGNYGWPKAQGAGGAPEFEPAVVDYEQVIAPSGATFVSRPGSAWTGRFLVAALRGEHLRVVSLAGNRASSDEPLFRGQFGRLRTVVEGPDGALYALTNNTDGRGAPRAGDDRILRIVPPGARAGR